MAEVSVEIAAPSVSGPHAYAAADAVRKSTKRKAAPPDDFPSAQDFLRHIRDTFGKDLEADQRNREEATQDARFVAGEQWDAAVRARRDGAAKPTLTINRLPAYVAQLVGNRRLNDTGIKVIPDSGGTRQVAEVREGLIRSIQKISRAQYVYDKAYEQQVIGGVGNFQVHLDYAYDDVFEQDIRLAAIPDPLSVVWDRNSVDPTGADAEHVFVIDSLPRAEYRRRYPQAGEGGFGDQASFSMDTSDTVHIVSVWRMRSRTRTVALMQTGDVLDVTDLSLEEWWDGVALDRNQEPVVRETQRRYAQMHLCSANDILAGPYELPVQRLPVLRVPGWEILVEGEWKRWGLIRFLRDPQRLHNYWRSTIAEKLISAPKQKWVAADSAVEGREDQWRRSHLSDDPLLIYNADSATPPIRMPPMDMETALIEQAGVASQDIRDVSNIHEANLGQASNEVSGRAIMARQRVGEVGSAIYQDNLNMAIEEAGKVINQLIPFVYDTPRVVKVLGPDMQTEKQVRINDEQDPTSVDITTGKYSISVVTGPSYTTRRIEAREEMMALVNAMPQTMGIAADKIVEAQDWPGAEEIAARIRSQLPPGMLDEEDLDDAQRQQQQATAEAAQQRQQLEQQMVMLELAEKEAGVMLKRAQVVEAQARAEEAQARAKQAMSSAAKNIAEITHGDVRLALETLEQAAPPTPNFAGNPGAE